MNVLTLYPFCTAESTGGKGTGLERIFSMDFSGMDSRQISLTQAIKAATYPGIFDKEYETVNIWFDGYLSTILQRDVKMLADLEKISVLPSLLRVLASRAGNLINDADLARDVGLNAVTGKFYRNILKMMFLTIDVPPWYRNIGKRLVKSAKGYLLDTLFLCYMLGFKLEDLAKSRPDLFGHVLENYVVMELIKLLSFDDSHAKLYHFRTSDGKEVDFILEKPDGKLWAIEVKNSDSVSAKDFTGIRIFEEITGKDFQGGIVLYSGKEAVPFGNNLWAVPHGVLWQ
jgi:predicted AAA+ superfamily ATPase